MERYPLLEIYRAKIEGNAALIRGLCTSAGIGTAAVVKGFNAQKDIVASILSAGFTTLASSRISHLAELRREYPHVTTLLLRIPMLSEVDESVAHADMSLVSELATLQALDRAAGDAGRTQGVILMRDLGDLREGVFEREQLYDLAVTTEKKLPHLHLLGIGTNLTCYGSVLATTKNLSELVSDAREIEARIGRRLEIISGGGSTSVPLLVQGGMPSGINHLRLGEGILLSHDFQRYYNCFLPGHAGDSFVLKAEIVEIGEKPTHPVGELGVNFFGATPQYEDRGRRRRALLALGAFDVGDPSKLLPQDSALQVMGYSSDHTIVDIHDSDTAYQLGDVISFTLCYQNMLFATANPLVAKKVL